MPRTVLMGDPAHFSVRGGANPHTRNILGFRKRIDPDLARRQWDILAQTLIAHGAEVLVIPPDPKLTGLVYPANAGFLYPLSIEREHNQRRVFYLANLLPTRAGEREVYQGFLQALGFETRGLKFRHEGEADFFPADSYMLFTHGRIERQRFVPRLGLPPWRRVYGFRSDERALGDLREICRGHKILDLELTLEAHYHGDTVACSFGAARENILVYRDGLTAESMKRLEQCFGPNLIELSRHDAELYAANSFQLDFESNLYLFMPEGVTDALLREVRRRNVEPVALNVSEFLAKGGGSIKCMILDLGPTEQMPADKAAQAFRTSRSWRNLFV